MSIYSDIGLSTTSTNAAISEASKKTGSTSLGMEDFLSLLTTQLSYQDPTNPTDNTQMVSQMAQLSVVQSLAELNTTADDLSSSVTSSMALMASSLVGQDVKLTTNTGFFNGADSSQFMISAGSGVQNMTLTITGENGEVINTVDIGDGSGDINLFWDGTNSNGEIVPSGNYKFTVNGLYNGTSQSIPVYAYGKVSSVTLGTGVSSSVLNLEGGGTMNMSQVTNIG